MRTIFILLAMYDGRVLIPLADVCRDFFTRLTPEQLVRKVDAGQITLPIIRTDPRSQKSMKGVHVSDLADYLDEQREQAEREVAAMAQDKVNGAARVRDDPERPIRENPDSDLVQLVRKLAVAHAREDYRRATGQLPPEPAEVEQPTQAGTSARKRKPTRG